MPKIKGKHNEAYAIDSVGKTYIFTKSYLGHSAYNAIYEQGRDNTIVLHGIAISNAGRNAIYSHGDGVTIRIASNGIVRGEGSAIDCYGAETLVVNEGKIFGSAGYGGIGLFENHSKFVNKGTVYSDGGAIDIRGDRSQAINHKGALISSDGRTISMVGDDGDTLRFVNHGKAETRGAPYAIVGYDGNDVIINDGKIIGSIILEDGEDRIDTRGGKVSGTIYGGKGDDTLITDKASYTLVEYAGQGFDTVKSTVTYTLTAYVEKLVLLGTKNIDGKGTAGNDVLVGNAGNNVLFGYEGNDRLDGKAGNDVLRGGLGADVFVFKTGYDKDRIVLFEDGTDKIDVSGWKAIKNFNDLINNHASDHGDDVWDVWIVAGSDRLVIKDTQKGDLDAGDFIV